MKKINYTHYCVAFLDILGFKNLVGKEDASTIHSIFNNIRYAKKLIRGVPGEDTWWEQMGKKTKIYFFSDSIVIAIPMSEPMALELVASNCMLLQHTLWYYGLPTWVRGGIAIGDLYCGNSEIFGPALIDAYMIEETVAKYPRIVMHESTYQAGIDNTDNRQDIIFIASQPNELRIVETLKYFDYEPQRSRVLRSIRDMMHKETNPSIREKFDWVIKYHGIDLNLSE